MAITATEAETAGVTFGATFFGYLVSARFVLTGAVLEAAAITGVIAAFAALGYHAYTGNVTAPPASPPPTP